MRKARIKAEDGIGFYHVMSRIAERSYKILLEVPAQPLLDDAVLLRRVRALYGAVGAEEHRERWALWRIGGLGHLAEREQEQLRRRMGDISPFMKLL